jgi:hypothetical protein
MTHIPTSMSNEIATRAARVMVREATLDRSARRIHFGVTTASRKVAPSIHFAWRVANRYGVTFARRDAAEAEAWLVAALLAGHCPFICFSRGGGGYCPNAMLAILEGRPTPDEAAEVRFRAMGRRASKSPEEPPA